MQTTIVIGLGAMGSATAQHLAERGQRVLGFDRFAPPHSLGSSHGRSRIIRQAYYEDPRYVPMLLRAYELWRRLERDSGRPLLHVTGGLEIGHVGGELVQGARRSSEQFGLPHEVLSVAELRRRFPVFATEDDTLALWERDAGYLLPEDCIAQQLRQAAAGGAELRTDEQVLGWTARAGGGVSVRTSRGSYEADRLVLTAGPWAPEMLAAMRLPLRVTRQVLFWFEPRGDADRFRRNRLPIYVCEPRSKGQPVLYGFPFTEADADGVKVALHGSDQVCTADTVRREVTAADEHTIRDRLAGTIPLLSGRLIRAETCLYTMTPDENFVIDTHPEFPQVALACGFSGHGFKFANVVGEILAELAMGRAPTFDLSFLSLSRFAT